jgi:uncharacterized membrane protein
MNERATPRRWLLASLALNLFLVCAIAGGGWRWWSSERAAAVAAAAHQPRGLRFAADGLNPEQRRAFLAGLRNARREVAPSIQAAQEGRKEVLRQIAAPTLDRDALAAALAATRTADIAVRARVEASVVDFAAGLSPDDRETLAGGLTRRSGLAPSNPTPKPKKQ